MAGPALAAAAWPVRTKMPVPMMAPTPEHDELTGAEHARQSAAVAVSELLRLDLFDRLGRKNGHQDAPGASLSGGSREVLKSGQTPVRNLQVLLKSRDNIRLFAMPATETSLIAVERQRPLPVSRSGRSPSIRARGSSAVAAGSRLCRPGSSECSSCSSSAPATSSSRQELIDSGLEGRLRHGHLAGRGRQRPAPGARRRPAGADLHSDAPPPRLSLRGAGVYGAIRRRRRVRGRAAGRDGEVSRLAVDWRTAGSVERGGHLCAHRRRRGLAAHTT